ncbi:hypothetical protein UK23_34720 [Lentzea aerocolonigenes]|uniref:Peptidase inhibitor family I36 protein n=1 Tax=Lentzea aerocolonigenes TaxID=68170 RepID=A0A0F0GI58_LENAE|nr:peptidase inhibitor family I36 protein [Lentzea aerocolonigenes]KJK43045.1 hypothetical protein UK23_34720 [Lentzea aerocolonigenes]
MIRKTMTVLAGAAFAAALVSIPASAAAPVSPMGEQSDVSVTAYSDCPAARMCIFNNLNGGRPWGYFAVGDANLGAAPGPSGLNNNAESGYNRTSQVWCFYDGAGYTNILGYMNPGDQYNFATDKRNKVTSLRVCP